MKLRPAVDIFGLLEPERTSKTTGLSPLSLPSGAERAGRAVSIDMVHVDP